MYRKKVLSNAVALSLGLSAAGVIGVAHAEADLLFPYVVSGDNVTTLLSVVNTAPPNVVAGRPNPQFTYDLAIALNYKLGSVDSAWNRDGCFHFDRTITTSVNDLSTFDIGGTKFGTGALFNDTVGGTGDFLNDVATFPGFRGYVHIRDVTTNLPAPERTLEGDALIIEFDTGAAWGYRGLSRSDAAGDTSWFQNLSNATYDVYPNNAPGLPTGGRGLNIPFMPMDQVNTRFFITVLNDDIDRQFDGTPGAVIAQMGGGAGQTLFNRLEQSRSLNASIQIDCFGVVDVEDFLAAAAGTPFMAQGGFSAVNVRDADPITGIGNEGLGLVNGKLAHIIKLEWALDPVAIDGEPVNGTFNNSYQLNYVTNALEATGAFPVAGWSVADRVTS